MADEAHNSQLEQPLVAVNSHAPVTAPMPAVGQVKPLELSVHVKFQKTWRELLQKYQHGPGSVCSSNGRSFRQEISWFLCGFLLAASFIVAVIVVKMVHDSNRVVSHGHSHGLEDHPPRSRPLPVPESESTAPGESSSRLSVPRQVYQVIRDIESLNTLALAQNTAVSSITITNLEHSGAGTPMAEPHDIKINSSTFPALTSVSIETKIPEHTLLRLLHAFAPTLKKLTLDMECLNLGGRLDRAGLATTPALSLPELRRLTPLNSNGSPLTPWVLTWDLPSACAIGFCSSFLDEATIEALEDPHPNPPSDKGNSAGRGVGTSDSEAQRVVVLDDTALCAGCQLNTARVMVTKSGVCSATSQIATTK